MIYFNCVEYAAKFTASRKDRKGEQKAHLVPVAPRQLILALGSLGRSVAFSDLHMVGSALRIQWAVQVACGDRQ